VSAAPEFLCGIEVVDTYAGEKIGVGLRGYTVRCRYQSSNKTLSNDEVDTIHAQVRLLLAQDKLIALR
jgi:phenylalanyl-tRNA synthetase beta subunit